MAIYYTRWERSRESEGRGREGGGKVRAESNGSESRNEKRGKITKKERDNSTRARARGYLWSLIFLTGGCWGWAGGRNDLCRKATQRWRLRTTEKGGGGGERRQRLSRCAGAISVNHRVITAPIIRYRDRSAERRRQGYHDRAPGIC